MALLSSGRIGQDRININIKYTCLFAAPVVPALSGLGGLGPAPPQRTSASTADPWGVQQPNLPAHQPANNDPWGAAPTQQVLDDESWIPKILDSVKYFGEPFFAFFAEQDCSFRLFQAPNPPVVQQQNDPWAAIQAPPPSSAVGRTASPQPPPPSGANTTIPACKCITNHDENIINTALGYHSSSV